MNTVTKSVALIIGFLIGVFSCSQTQEYAINIAIASNVQFPMEEVETAFEKTHNIKCNLILNSSGKITTQISEGAPYDVFLSANTSYPEFLSEKGHAFSTPKVYCYGKLILMSLGENIPSNLTELIRDDYKRIAIPNARFAPYGMAAEHLLNKHELTESLKNKLVIGESVSQTNQFLFSRAADLAFTSKSTIYAKQFQGKAQWLDFDPVSYPRIEQGMVVLKNGKAKKEDVDQFVNFLFSDISKEIFERYGYELPE